MDESRNIDGKKEKTESASFDFLEDLTQAAEAIITEAGAKAGREAEQELEKVLDEYERKTKQIILKIKEETKTKTAEIAGKLGEAIMLRIEQTSARAVNNALSELSSRARALTGNVQETVQKETDQQVSKVSTGLWDSGEDADKGTYQEEEDIAEAKEEESEKESKSDVTEEDIKLHQSIENEDFESWLTQ